MSRKLGWSVATVVAIVACGGAQESNLLQPVSGTDSGSGGNDTGLPDTGSSGDAGGDTSSGMDSSEPPDAGMDTNPPPKDTGPKDTGSDLPPVFCGSKTCPVPKQVCCVDTRGGGYPNYDCTDFSGASGCASDGKTPVACDTAADCPSGVCCGQLNAYDTGYQDVLCAPSCPNDGSHVIFCDPAAVPSDCPFGSCHPSSLLPGYDVCG